MLRVIRLLAVPALVLTAVQTTALADAGRATAAHDGASEASTVELDRVVARLEGPDPAGRSEAVKAALALGDDATPAIEKRLADLRASTADLRPVFKAMHDTNAGKMGEDWDLLDALVRGRMETPAWREATTTLTLVRALGRIGTTRAVKAMIPVAIDHQRLFQGEVQTQLRALGERAVAALIESRKDPSGEVRRFGSAQLEAMNKKVPGEAVQTKNNQVLADVLRAYGLVRDADAMGVILSFVNSERAQVRTAAREALAAFGQDAIWKLRETFTNVVGKPPPEQWNAEQVAKELFAAYDRFRLQDVYSLFEEGLARYKDQRLEEATAAFDKVLARQPAIERRAEMVPAYVAYAQQIEDADRVRALALFRKALRLDPEGPRAAQIQSEIAYLDGMDLLARGIADTSAFRRALALDGGHAKARGELERLEAARETREERTRKWAAAGAVIAVALALVALFGGARGVRPAKA